MSVGWICHRTVLVFCSAIVACVAPPYVLGESPNDLVQFQGVGGCAGGSTRCTGFPQTKSSILCRARFVVVALFLIARGVHVHGFVVQFQGVGGCAGRSTRCTKFPQTKSSILWRVQFVVVALFLIARGVPVHEFVVSARHAGLQRGYEHRLFNRISNYLFNCPFNRNYKPPCEKQSHLNLNQKHISKISFGPLGVDHGPLRRALVDPRKGPGRPQGSTRTLYERPDRFQKGSWSTPGVDQDPLRKVPIDSRKGPGRPLGSTRTLSEKGPSRHQGQSQCPKIWII